MPDKVALKPARAGLVIPNPQNKNKPLAAEGEAVTYDTYFRRRVKDGDAVIVTPAPAAAAKSNSNKQTKE